LSNEEKNYAKISSLLFRLQCHALKHNPEKPAFFEKIFRIGDHFEIEGFNLENIQKGDYNNLLKAGKELKDLIKKVHNIYCKVPGHSLKNSIRLGSALFFTGKNQVVSNDALIAEVETYQDLLE
jgi:hypothetical protein